MRPSRPDAFSARQMSRAWRPSSVNYALGVDTATEDKRLEVQLNYAWSWFQYHAGQRLAAFNFFLIIAGVVALHLRAQSTNTGRSWGSWSACLAR
jgi:hypothetical protein